MSARSIHVRLDDESAGALAQLREDGQTDSDAVRAALRDAARRRRGRSALRAEAERLAGDSADRRELADIDAILASIAPDDSGL